MLELTNVCLNTQLTDETVGERSTLGFEHAFAPGEITVVLGANQSGKTNLCRLIAGLNSHARGQVRLDGTVLDGLGPRQRPVSMVYQAFVNYPNLTVADNIASPLVAQRLPGAQVEARVAELAAKLQITELLSRLPHELSGGQQQRLAIARALAKNARVLLLDEPLVNLDFKLREALEVELRDLLHASNTIVIYNSSDPRDAFTLGDQVMLLAGGKKIQAGAPIDVYTSPTSLVAMELLADPTVNLFSQSGDACALRPEHVGVASDTAEAGNLNFDMLVSAYETNGDESFVHGLVDEQEWVVRCRGMLAVQVGQTLALAAHERDVVRY